MFLPKCSVVKNGEMNTWRHIAHATNWFATKIGKCSMHWCPLNSLERLPLAVVRGFGSIPKNAFFEKLSPIACLMLGVLT